MNLGNTLQTEFIMLCLCREKVRKHVVHDRQHAPTFCSLQLKLGAFAANFKHAKSKHIHRGVDPETFRRHPDETHQVFTLLKGVRHRAVHVLEQFPKYVAAEHQQYAQVRAVHQICRHVRQDEARQAEYTTQVLIACQPFCNIVVVVYTVISPRCRHAEISPWVVFLVS
jgi:hypothetical protein